jgi:hypothetical protein
MWEHATRAPAPAPRLADVLGSRRAMATLPERALARQLREARRLLAALPETAPAIEPPALTQEFERIRWFPLPGEAVSDRRYRRSTTRHATATSAISRNPTA